MFRCHLNSKFSVHINSKMCNHYFWDRRSRELGPGSLAVITLADHRPGARGRLCLGAWVNALIAR